MSKVTNKVEITGQVVGVYPFDKAKPSGGGSYRLVYATLSLEKKPTIVENYIFVRCKNDLPTVNDVVEVSGLLSIVDKKIEGTKEYKTSVSLIEESRGFLREGKPRERKQFTPRENSQSSRDTRSTNSRPSFNTEKLDDIPF